MRSVFDTWLAAEFELAEAELRWREALRASQQGRSHEAPPVAEVLRCRVLRHEARKLLQEVLQRQAASFPSPAGRE